MSLKQHIDNNEQQLSENVLVSEALYSLQSASSRAGMEVDVDGKQGQDVPRSSLDFAR